ALSTIRELRVPPKREPLVNKHRQSFAARRQPSSIARRITTSYANKGTSVLGSIKANRLTMLPNLSTLNHQSTIQNKNSEITSDSLLEPMKNLKFDALEDQQKCEGDKKTSNGNHIPTVAEFRLFKELETSNHQSTIQKKNSEITSDSLLEPMKNLKFDALDNQQKCEGDKETSNESHIPTVAEFRLFEELEKLEKQLEQEISEDLSDI
ncbi:9317_t:CDS:2, partial [Scutellospora calospora]